MIKKALFTLLIITFLSVPLACKEVSQEAPDLLDSPNVDIDMTEVILAPFCDVDVYPGYVAPIKHELSFTVDGQINEAHAYTGQEVHKGDLLIDLGLEDLQKEQAEIEKEVEHINSSAVYEDHLFELDSQHLSLELQEIIAISGTDSDAYRLKSLEMTELNNSHDRSLRSRTDRLTALNDRLREVSVKLEQSTLYAPCDGIFVMAQGLLENGSVKADAVIGYVLDDTEMEFVSSTTMQNFKNPATDYYAFINGTRYDITLEQISREEYLRLTTAGMSVDNHFTFNESYSDLSVGMDGYLMLETCSEEEVLQLPTNAIYSNNGDKYVYVVTEHGSEKRLIETGRSQEAMTEILFGLEEGDQVYVQE